MHARVALLAALALLVSGCVGTGDPITENEAVTPTDTSGITKVQERHELEFITDDAWSHTLQNGTFDILEGKSVFFDVEVPLGEGLPTQRAHMGIFLPEIPGCDWEADELPERCQVPVVADIGPYYGEPVLGDVPATEPATRLGGFLIENLVPHGYAVAQVSVLGTGESGGCMDLMGEVEQAGVQAAVEELGTAPWSNGNVGLTGRSYDGSTPWEAAMAGSDHLKTVVPISGLYGQQDLMWRNGSAESRGPGVLWGLYYAFTYTGQEPVTNPDGDPTLQAQQIAENALCPDTQTGAVHGLQAYATGDKGPLTYWEERSFKDEVLENYRGSVYFIHGMQDWNVDPHMAFPFYQELEAQGLEIKGLFGQWDHAYPDREGDHEDLSEGYGAEAFPATIRYDWAQDLKEWFDHYLKGTGEKPQLHVEIQDNQGHWRIEQTWPPQDNMWGELAFGEELVYKEGDALLHPANGQPMVADGIVLETEPLKEQLRIAGMPQLHVEVQPQGTGGQVYAELVDATDGIRLGHAIMDLRYHQGGDQMQTVVPGQSIIAKMQFFPMDVVVPAGHTLELRFADTGQDYLPPVNQNPVIVPAEGESVLRLPVPAVTPEQFFLPPGPHAILPDGVSQEDAERYPATAR